MRKGPLVHGALLVVALGVGWQTWTRDRTVTVRRGSVTVWSGAPAAIQSVALDGERRKVRLERRADPGGGYLWGAVTRIIPPPPKPPRAATPDGGPEAAMSMAPETQPAPKTTVHEFPVGEGGDKLLERLAPLLALRDLGALDDKTAADYGLADPKDKLVVQFQDGPRELTLGGRVFGGDDRYVLDRKSNRVYVVPGDVVAPLEAAESSLRERKLHAFAEGELATVAIQAGDKEKVVVRGQGKTPGSVTWAAAGAPDKPDQTLANFLDRVDKLTAMEYVVDLDESGLTPVVRLDYRSKAGASLGYLSLLRQTSADGKDAEFYVRTERTRVLAKVPRPLAERVDGDLAQILQ